MTLVRARVITPGDLGGRSVKPVEPTSGGAARARVAPRVLVEGEARARAIVAAAEARAREIVHTAERDAADVRLRAEAEGRADGAAAVAAHAVALAVRDAKSEELALDRVVELARLLAERLVGQAVAGDPEPVTALARQVLAQARGARRFTLSAHPEDARVLTVLRAELGVDPSLLEIQSDPARARGDLFLVTDIGVLDGALAPQLERLSIKLRQALSG